MVLELVEMQINSFSKKIICLIFLFIFSSSLSIVYAEESDLHKFEDKVSKNENKNVNSPKKIEVYDNDDNEFAERMFYEFLIGIYRLPIIAEREIHPKNNYNLNLNNENLDIDFGNLCTEFSIQRISEDIINYNFEHTIFYKRLNLGFEYSHFIEDKKYQNYKLDIVDFSADYVFAKFDRALFKAGIGIKGMYGDETQYGFKLNLYEVEYIGRYITLKFGNALSIFENNSIYEFTAGIGIVVNNNTGISLEYESISTEEGSYMDGPKLSLKYWY